METFVKGCILGLSIAAPVGPIGLLCIRRTLTYGKSQGFVTGLGAATADTIYGCIAAFGLSVATRFLVKQAEWLHLAGAIFLLYMAIRTFTSAVASKEANTREGRSYAWAYASTLLLTLTNPMTILSFLGLFAGLNIADNTVSAAWLVVGVTVGSAAWWLILSLAVGSFKRRINERTLQTINYGAALVLLGFGLYSLYEALRIGL